MASEPKPPQGKHGTLRALRKATLDYCNAWYTWKHGSEIRPAFDYTGEIAAYKHAISFERDARNILGRLKQVTELAEAFVQRYPKGNAAYGSERVAAALPLMRKALEGRGVHFRHAEEPSRRTWIADCVAPFFRGKLSDHELSVYAILGGWWPDVIDEDRIAAVAESGGVSVAEVMREERKRIGKAKIKPKSLQRAEERFAKMLLPAIKRRPST